MHPTTIHINIRNYKKSQSIQLNINTSEKSFSDCSKDRILTNKQPTSLHLTEVKTCRICLDQIKYPKAKRTKILCGCFFCQECYYEYLKEKINNNEVENIPCMNKNCQDHLEEKFIKDMIKDDENLLKKYLRFIERLKVFEIKKPVRFCPHPDCNGYAVKNKINRGGTSKTFNTNGSNKSPSDKASNSEVKNNGNFVKCNYGHVFCFRCGLEHKENENCLNSTVVSDGFKKYKKKNHIKKCPRCHYETEKISGCNHITCFICKFQWCWLCGKEYNSNHYNVGSCKGLQYFKGNSLNEIRMNLRRRHHILAKRKLKKSLNISVKILNNIPIYGPIKSMMRFCIIASYCIMYWNVGFILFFGYYCLIFILCPCSFI